MPVACCQWVCTDIGPQTAMIFGPIPIIKLGYAWWELDGFAMDLMYIRFKKQMFLPPNSKVTKLNYLLLPGVHGDMHLVYSKIPDDPISILGNVLSAKLGSVPGLAQTLIGGGLGAPPTVTPLGTNKRLKLP